jgi:hypothetical protein
LVRSPLAIYITLFAVASVAIAQILYWKLVITRRGTAGDAAPEVADMGSALEPVDPWAGFAADASEPVPVSEPGRVREPVLVGA